MVVGCLVNTGAFKMGISGCSHLVGDWRSGCKFIFQDIHESVAVVIKAMWNDLMHALQGEFHSRDFEMM
jgi:hypothetical protein